MLHLLMATLLSFWGNPPLSVHAVPPLFPVHAATACERDAAVWSPCGSCTLGKGGWDGSCMLNKCSLKATRYLHLPSGCELMETQPWKCSGFPVSSSLEHRESCSGPSDQVTVSGFIPGYQDDHHPDLNMPFQSWFLSRETNFQLSDPLVSLAGSAGQSRALPYILNPTWLCPLLNPQI